MRDAAWTGAIKAVAATTAAAPRSASRLNPLQIMSPTSCITDLTRLCVSGAGAGRQFSEMRNARAVPLFQKRWFFVSK
jgi:hypothetical protein